MATVIKYRIFCETENTYVYWYKDSNESLPTTCSNNTAHTVTAGSCNSEETIGSQIVKIKEENITTNGYFQMGTVKLMVPPLTTLTYDTVYPYNISVYSMKFRSIESMCDDVVNLFVAPNTVVGILTSSITSPGHGTVLNVSSTVISNMKPGFLVNLLQASNGQNESLGRVFSINAVTSQITVENEPTLSFSAAAPTYVRLTMQPVRDMIISYPGDESVGTDLIGGSGIPANTIIRAQYENKSATETKKFVCRYEITY